jgi:hypothetical protein
MTWDDIAQSYANLGWGGEGEGRKDCQNCQNRVIAKIENPNRSTTKDTKERKVREVLYTQKSRLAAGSLHNVVECLWFG